MVAQMDVVLEALERESLLEVKNLLQHEGKPFHRLLQNKYLEGEGPDDYPQPHPDVELRRLNHAALIWKKLSPEERQSLVSATSAIYGPSQGEELEQLLTIRLPL